MTLAPETQLPPPQAAPNTVAFCTLGCKTNLLESSALAEQFRHLGWQITPFESPASLYVFNTCTVTEKADSESRRLIRRAKRQNPHARVAVTGCYAQVAPEVIAAMDGVDFVIGNNLKQDLPRLVVEQFADYRASLAGGALIAVDEFEKSRRLEVAASDERPVVGSASGIERTRGSLKIQDGCDYKCTYCIIWKGRGPSRSVPPEAVESQLRAMIAAGFKEISLTGINIGQYLWQESAQKPATDLTGLLKRLISIDGEFRLRLTSLDPLEVSDELIEMIASSGGKICPHLHLSTQSADDSVLKTMARRHHVADLKRICHALQAAMPSVCISADIIVGFPTETEAAFEATYQVLSEIPMHQLHVFRYSPRPGTPAAELKPQVPERIRKERAQKLLALAELKKQQFYQQIAAQPAQVLLEYPKEDGTMEGWTEHYSRVLFSPQQVKAWQLKPNYFYTTGFNLGQNGLLLATQINSNGVQQSL